VAVCSPGQRELRGRLLAMGDERGGKGKKLTEKTISHTQRQRGRRFFTTRSQKKRIRMCWVTVCVKKVRKKGRGGGVTKNTAHKGKPNLPYLEREKKKKKPERQLFDG